MQGLIVIDGHRKYRLSRIKLAEQTYELLNSLSHAFGIPKSEILEEIVEAAINDPDIFESVVRRHDQKRVKTL